MTVEGSAVRASASASSRDVQEFSLLSVSLLLLRHRRLIVGFIVVGIVLGVVVALLTPRKYEATTTFIPTEAESPASGLALAASQLGIRVPSGSSTWGPPLYVELLNTRSILDSVSSDTVVVTEEGARRAAVVDLLEVRAPTPERRAELAARRLRTMISATEVKQLSGVKLAVVTRWPSVSLAIAQRLVRGVNQFNLSVRKTQASAERSFVEAQAADAEKALRVAEDRLQGFMQTNRMIAGSPELTLQRDRLQRDVSLRQELQTSWLKSREEARIREVRNTPVITILEEARLPTVPQPRGLLLKALFGAIAGGAIAVVVALLVRWAAAARATPASEERELLDLVEELIPRFLRRNADGRVASV